ncbi:MAG TPA: acetyl-CoA acetyltransferase [Acidimicrobiia bacterium]|nr:acetyl-CoA acetyltransferase [Acidimicrobiia bacterium]
MADEPVFVLGGRQTDFARNWTAEGTTLFDALREAALGALEDAAISPADVDSVEVGNFVGELFTGQGHLGGLAAAIHPDLAHKAGARHEAACASGSMAALAGLAQIQAGWSDVVLVIGAEQMRNVDAATGAAHLGAAMWVGKESEDAVFPWPHQFSLIADAYAERHGLDHRHLAAIADKNFTNARANPLAQSRAWSFEPEAFGTDDVLNPVVEGRLRKQDCGRITDGAAAVVLASGRYVGQHGLDGDGLARVAGWGRRSAPMLLSDKLAASSPGGLMFPHVAEAVSAAQKRAGITLDDLDLVETHDCFTISEYMAYDHLGLTAPGQSWQVVEDEAARMDGRLPVNPSGGLIGDGHPVGATGVRMLVDAARQVTGTAGGVQVDGARTAQTINIGGSTTTVASFVVAR